MVHRYIRPFGDGFIEGYQYANLADIQGCYIRPFGDGFIEGRCDVALGTAQKCYIRPFGDGFIEGIKATWTRASTAVTSVLSGTASLKDRLAGSARQGREVTSVLSGTASLKVSSLLIIHDPQPIWISVSNWQSDFF